MEIVLRRKSTFDHSVVARVWENIEEHVTREEAAAAVEAAACETRQVVANLGVDRPVLGWSGGKDSQALRVVADHAGVPYASMIGIVRAVEWPAMLDFIDQHAPPGCRVYSNDVITLDWLRDHPRYLFPQGADGQWWTLRGTRQAQHRYQADHAPDLWLFGRRRADNNWIAPAPYGIHTDRRGMRQYSPIRDWPHELVLAVCKFYETPMAPVYAGPEGWLTGTGPWPGRRPKGDPWANTWAIDPDVVRAAAAVLPQARAWMETTGRT